MRSVDNFYTHEYCTADIKSRGIKLRAILVYRAYHYIDLVSARVLNSTIEIGEEIMIVIMRGTESIHFGFFKK